MRAPLKLIQKVFQSAGLELVRYPPGDEAQSRNILRRTLKDLSINCVFDVGANRGQYGLLLRDYGYSGQIFSFEPVRANFEALAERAAKAGPWTCFHYALGAAKGTAEINVTEEDVFSSFLTPSEDSKKRFPRNRVTCTETVTIKRLDTVLPECISGMDSPRIYLKMDTQGFDLEVLAGASGVISRILALQSELSFRPIYNEMPSYLDSLKVFMANGFRVVDFIPVSRDRDGLSVVEMDCVLVRAEQ